jgi:hypothetical protein
MNLQLITVKKKHPGVHQNGKGLRICTFSKWFTASMYNSLTLKLIYFGHKYVQGVHKVPIYYVENKAI